MPMIEASTKPVDWFSSINWGTVPDWVTGLLTAATLFLAVMILLGDRRRAKRAEADAFSTWPVFMGTHAVPDLPDYAVELHAYNAGDKPILYTMVMVRPGSPQHALQTMSTKPIPPQTEVVSKIGFDNIWYDSPLLIQFRDARGQTWLRDVNTNKYIGKSQVNKWYRKYGKTRAGMYHFLFTNRNRDLIKKDMEEQRLRWEAEEAARVPEKTRKKRGRVR